MSIRSLTHVAAQRDEESPKNTANEPLSWKDAVVAQIPTEMLGLYTPLVALIAGAVKDEKDKFVGERLAILVAFVLLTAAFVVAGYNKKRTGEGFKIPILETTVVVVAFAVWGAAMPESPLFVNTDPPASAIWPPIIGTFGAGILLVLAQFLPKKRRA